MGKVAVFTAATESFNLRNVNASIAASIERFRPVVEGAKRAGLPVRGLREHGVLLPLRGADAARGPRSTWPQRLLDLGCDEIDLGRHDRRGDAPGRGGGARGACSRAWPSSASCSTSTTRGGPPLVNVVEGLRHGVAALRRERRGHRGLSRTRPGATGNLATEDLVYLLDGLGIATGVDLETLRAAGEPLEAVLGHRLPGKVYRAGSAPMGPHCGGPVRPPPPDGPARA